MSALAHCLDGTAGDTHYQERSGTAGCVAALAAICHYPRRPARAANGIER
jgi:hypothetical protein